MRTDRAAAPLLALTRARLKHFIREPRVVFWSSGFPIVLAITLGTAFREAPDTVIAVLPGPNADALAATVAAQPHLVAERLSAEQAKARLHAMTLLLAVEPTDHGLVYHLDPTRTDAVAARTTVDDVLQRAAGRTDVLPVRDEMQTAQGSRYVDWLIPGLLGMQMFTNALFLIVYGIAAERQSRELKQLAATPMRRTDYFLSYFLSRLCVLVAEVPVMLAFGYFVFGVKVHGSLAAVVAASVVGTFTFCGLSVLLAYRATRAESAGGVVGFAMLPAYILSGIFFSASRFPAALRPAIAVLPLTALNDTLRSVVNDGAGLLDITGQLAIIAAWGVAAFALSAKIFRWT